MNFFIKRYTVDFIIMSLIIFAAWMGTVWYFEGALPIIAGIIFFVFFVSYIPYMIHQDYQKIKGIKDDYKKMKANEISKETFHRNWLLKISDEFGVPEIIAEKILQKVIKEKLPPLPTETPPQSSVTTEKATEINVTH